MRREELEQALRWADEEGWEPGLTDAEPFWAADPGGYWVEELDGEMVACLSAVRYGDGPVFMGFYIVAPGHRGTGLGKRLVDGVLEALAGRTLLGDAVPEQVETYARIGFEVAWWNTRFIADGPLPAPEGRCVAAVEVDFDALVAFDAAHAPGPRPALLGPWIAGPGRRALVTTDGARITGFGAARRTSAGHRIGPLVAERPADARELMLALADGLDGPVAVDLPLPNAGGGALVEELGMRQGFQSVRVVRGAPFNLPLERIYGIGSLELG